MKPFFTILFFVSTICSFAQPLSGTYTVGGETPDFPSVANAVNQLNSLGVGSGGAEFIIRSGEYLVAFELNAIGSAEGPVVFRSETGNAADVALGSAISADVATINGAAYINISDITIRVTGNNAYSAIQIGEASHHIFINDCILEGTTGSLTSYSASVIYANSTSANQNCTDIHIENTVFRNGSYGFCADMSGVTSDSILVSNCEFENQYAGGVFMKDLFAPAVEKNKIFTSQTGNTGYNGISWDNCDGPGRITGNDIFTVTGGRANYGIELNGSAGEAGNEIIIANNSIEVNNQNSLCYGLAQSNNCNYYRIFHNLIFISGGNSSGSSAYQTFVFDGSTDFYNNILVSNADGSTNRCVYIANQSGMAFIDYNCYWTMNAGSNFIGYFGGAQNDFSSYIATTGEDYSLNLDPQIEFIEEKGWRATSENLLSTALYVEEFQTDIDENQRPDPPCIGANEVDQLTTGLSAASFQDWYVYSYNNTLMIGGELNDINEVLLIDLSGRLVLSSKVKYSAGLISIPVYSISAGFYLAGVSAKGQMEFKKVLVN